MFLRIVLVTVLYFFFFFKQKTAYEMRISDWSSDVCSSDLPGDRGQHMRHDPERAAEGGDHAGPGAAPQSGRQRVEHAGARRDDDDQCDDEEFEAHGSFPDICGTDRAAAWDVTGRLSPAERQRRLGAGYGRALGRERGV